MGDDREPLRYRRSRFATRLPREHRYSGGHLWVARQERDLWRVGFTRFATRMLGEPVEVDFEVREGEAIERGQEVGWIEGFKAVTDIYTPMGGRFAGANPTLETEVEAVAHDPYRRGWLFLVEGTPGEDLVGADGYTAILDETIDRMTGRDA
ncbi:MAG: glycine cleavage system protein H [Acidobacteriota bacterium]